MKVRLVALLLGLPFGFLIAWSGMNDPDVIRRMMLLQDWYLYKMFAVAVTAGLLGSLALRRLAPRALVTRRPVAWKGARPERRHVVGSVIFGCGWAITTSCPGPVATQLAGGLWWSGLTIAGISAGILLFFVRRERQPAAEAKPDGVRALDASASA